MYCKLSRGENYRYVDTKAASEILGLSRRALEMRRYRDAGPPFIKLGRKVRYREDQLIDWMERHRQSQPHLSQ